MSYCFRNVRAIFFFKQSNFQISQLFSLFLLSPFFLFSFTSRKLIVVYYDESEHVHYHCTNKPFHSKVIYVRFTYFFDTPCQNKNQSNCGFIHHHSTENESCKQQHLKSSQALLKHHYLYQLIQVSEIAKIVDVRKFTHVSPERQTEIIVMLRCLFP